jgi:hypothetical protein
LLERLQKENAPAHLTEEVCMEALAKDLRPSKYNYIMNILEEDFETVYHQLQESGTLLYEVVNMIAYSKPAFEGFGFSEENEDNRQLKYAVTGAVSEYLAMNQ